jgi:hypothetical protein
MAGVSSVVFVSPAIPAQELNVVDSAARAGVDHGVKITSKASADSPIARRGAIRPRSSGLIASSFRASSSQTGSSSASGQSRRPSAGACSSRC